jgi:hypothetical protein
MPTEYLPVELVDTEHGDIATVYTFRIDDARDWRSEVEAILAELGEQDYHVNPASLTQVNVIAF